MVKKLLLVSFCFVLLFSVYGGTCLAQEGTTYQITSEELTRLDEIFNQLSINNQKLLNDLEMSKKDSEEVRLQLVQYQRDLIVVQNDLLKWKEDCRIAKTELQIANDSLEKVSQSLKRFEKDHKRIKLQRDLLAVGLVAVLVKK